MTKPILIMIFAAVIGVSMVAAGVYVLAGIGWALLVGAVPFLALSAVLMRGLTGAK